MFILFKRTEYDPVKKNVYVTQVVPLMPQAPIIHNNDLGVGSPFIPKSMAYANEGSNIAEYNELNPAPRRIGSAFLYSSPESF